MAWRSGIALPCLGACSCLGTCSEGPALALGGLLAVARFRLGGILPMVALPPFAIAIRAATLVGPALGPFTAGVGC